MSISSPSRRRLLRRAAGAVLSLGGLRAGVLDALPGVRRRDPRIQTSTYRRAELIQLHARAIGVRPFEAGQAGKPSPPDFAKFLARSLGWAFPESVVEIGSQPTIGVGVLIEGRVELLHRLGAQGLRAVVSVNVFDVSADEQFVLWSGTKKADWVRRFPTDDCLLTLADDFVAEWSERG